jgi:hypothetical protein
VERLEAGESVVVPSWALGRWVSLWHPSCGGPSHVRLESTGDVVPVVPVKVDDLSIEWEPL